MEETQLKTPISHIKGIGEYFTGKFKKLGIYTIKDLLFHFPSRYIDFSHVVPIAELKEEKTCTIRGIIEKIEMRKVWHRHMFITEAIVSDGSGKISIIWFNQTYIKKSLQKNMVVNFSGKIVKKGNHFTLTNPLYEIAEKLETNHTARIVPVYSETSGITSKGIRFFLHPLLQRFTLPEILPLEIIKKENLMNRNTALHLIHFPKKLSEALQAKNRFIFEELFFLSLYMERERKKIREKKANQIIVDSNKITSLMSHIPFSLTDSQKKSLSEIISDIQKSSPMYRLLQGDVGSGKTIVAGIIAVLAAQKGFQTAFMAPTTILAQQHYRNLEKLFGELGYGIALITSNESRLSYGSDLETKITKNSLIKEIESGKIKIIVGTHSLLEKKVSFHNLSLVIIDEQHRFGIHARAKLLTPQQSTIVPHFLSMSATPIPRTLSLVLWADLDFSMITELPKNRKPIKTIVVPKKHRLRAYEAIRKEIKNGRQIFVVCPRIDPAEDIDDIKEVEKLEIKSVKTEFEKLSKKIFPEFSIGMLHGKMSPLEKENTMANFSAGKINILVSTSVVEVGIDVPNATIMMIESAERFGMAQLYQFRGRVGRGIHQSYCFLFTENENEEIKKRLSYLEKAKNGFELAEYDLQTRGPGEFLGSAQSGFPDIAMQAFQNPLLLKNAKEYAKKIITKDPELKTYPLLKKRIEEFAGILHRE